jgi:uncharacterized protein involved in exopolysaccharide biosynthesis
MRNFTVAVLFSLLTAGAALAQMPAGVPQPAPDPAFISAAIQTLQQQRNNALDEVAQAKAQLALTQSQLASTKKELDDLKAANAPKPAEPKAK